jgi:hypothetical protein
MTPAGPLPVSFERHRTRSNARWRNSRNCNVNRPRRLWCQKAVLIRPHLEGAAFKCHNSRNCFIKPEP